MMPRALVLSRTLLDETTRTFLQMTHVSTYLVARRKITANATAMKKKLPFSDRHLLAVGMEASTRADPKSPNVSKED